MSDVTRILSAIERGNQQASEELLPLVYDELRQLAASKMAQERPGQTLQATALVHEAYVRLVGGENAQHWDSRRHFFAAAAEAMRRILVENARRKARLKRGGAHRRVELEPSVSIAETPHEELLDLDEALSRLAKEDPQKVEIVLLRHFAGCSLKETAELLGISLATTKRHWAFARAWLFAELKDPAADSQA